MSLICPYYVTQVHDTPGDVHHGPDGTGLFGRGKGTKSHHHTYYVTSSYTILSHIIIHTKSHHHAY